MSEEVEALLRTAVGAYGAGRLAEAAQALEAAIALAPDHARAWSHLGALRHALSQPEAALAALERASALDPALIEPHLSRGAMFDLQGRFEDAAQAWGKAAALAPRAPEIRHRLAIALGRSGQAQAEAAAYDGALALDPGNVILRRNRGLALLRLGRFDEGWSGMEARTLQPGATFVPASGARWRGEPPATGARRLLIFHEEGAGDGLQFVRFVAQAAGRGFAVVLWVPPVMTELMATLGGGEGVEVTDQEPVAFDLWCGMLSLPWVLRVRLEDLPMGEAYLKADPARLARMQARLGPRRGLRIGLAWSGRPTNENDAIRSIPFAALEPLLAVEADWHALQNEVRASDRAAFAASGRVAFHGEALGDFADAAALAQAMDLVISVDTSLAHLAGALGKQVWVLLPFAADWRWMTGRDDSPWYPSARLFRQARRGDWAGVLERVAARLREEVGGGD